MEQPLRISATVLILAVSVLVITPTVDIPNAIFSTASSPVDVSTALLPSGLGALFSERPEIRCFDSAEPLDANTVLGTTSMLLC